MLACLLVLRGSLGVAAGAEKARSGSWRASISQFFVLVIVTKS